MKFTALVLLLVTIFYLYSVQLTEASTSIIYNNIKAESSSGEGGNAKVDVNVQNNVNTGNNNNSSSSQIKTKVTVKQSGDGTSSVKINGQEWKQEGPGEINVDETTSTSSSSQNGDVLSTYDDEKENQEGEVLSAETEAHLTFTQKLKLGFSNFKTSFISFFTKIFRIFN